MSVTVNLCPTPKLQFSQNGVPLAGGKLFTYAAGTSTKLATYANAGGTTTNNNPIILDANGQCDCYLQGGLSYKLVLAPATDTDPPQNPYWTEDNITGINQVLSTFGTDVGVANAYDVNLNPALTSYANGQQVVFDASNSSTGASTLNVNGLGPKQLLVNGQATVANSIQAGQRYVLSYSSTANAFLVLSSSSPAIQASSGSFSGNVSIGGLLSGTSGNPLNVSGSISATGSGSFTGVVSVGAAASGSTDAPQIAQTVGAGATAYTNQASNRAINTTYTNNTGRPLWVSIYFYVPVPATTTTNTVMYVNNLNCGSAVQAPNPSSTADNIYVGIVCLVPPGQTYELSGVTGISIVQWWEY